MTVSADGNNLVVSSWFGSMVQVWDPQTDQVLEEYKLGAPINAIRFKNNLVVAEDVYKRQTPGFPEACFSQRNGMEEHRGEVFSKKKAMGQKRLLGCATPGLIFFPYSLVEDFILPRGCAAHRGEK